MRKIKRVLNALHKIDMTITRGYLLQWIYSLCRAWGTQWCWWYQPSTLHKNLSVPLPHSAYYYPRSVVHKISVVENLWRHNCARACVSLSMDRCECSALKSTSFLLISQLKSCGYRFGERMFKLSRKHNWIVFSLSLSLFLTRYLWMAGRNNGNSTEYYYCRTF